MSSLTMRHGGASAAFENAIGHLSTFLQSLIAAREKEARHRAAAYLGALSDERLGGLGLGPEEITAIRAGTFDGVRGGSLPR